MTDVVNKLYNFSSVSGHCRGKLRHAQFVESMDYKVSVRRYHFSWVRGGDTNTHHAGAARSFKSGQ